jgi:hypothetical protein
MVDELRAVEMSYVSVSHTTPVHLPPPIHACMYGPCSFKG